MIPIDTRNGTKVRHKIMGTGKVVSIYSLNQVVGGTVTKYYATTWFPLFEYSDVPCEDLELVEE